MFRLLAAIAAPALLLAAPAIAAQAPAAAAPAVQPDPGTPAPNFSSERIGVTVMGSGPDVVLIPGLSSTPAVWSTTMAALPGYRYHLIHVSGFAGRPAGANARGNYLVPVADEIARYIREARLDRPAVVGHSMGGTWGILVASRHPELVGKLMVVDMLPYLGIMFRQQGVTDEQLTTMIDQMQTMMVNATPEQRRMMASMTISQMVNTESQRQAQIDASLASDSAVAAQGFTDLLRTNLLEDVGRIRAPLVVLYVQPSGAPGGPPITAEQIDRAYQLSYRAAPQAVIRRVPDAAHFIMFDNAPFFQAQLREFLTTPGTARPATPPAQ
ncbi:MAG TPA: alpha/beta hydrolase [Allosphingosinicella sp.]|nr:alpha/beta hydrolase [Allosphingosinicella sp.]